MLGLDREVQAGGVHYAVRVREGAPGWAELAELVERRGAEGVRLAGTLGALCGPALSLRAGAPAVVWGQLEQLASGQVAGGVVELIRCVLAVCPAHLDRVAAALTPTGRYGHRALLAFIAICVDARAALTAYDPLELGPARALGYGREIGQALHRAGGLPPAAAAGLGLLVAGRLGGLGPADELAHRELLLRAGLPVTVPGRTDLDAVAAAVPPALLLLDRLGHPRCVDGRLLTPVDPAAVRAALSSCRRPAGVPHSRPAVTRAPDRTASPAARDNGRDTVEASGPNKERPR
ncbi:hypothetical protein [Kitasatospora sp. NPDC002040]|uniref:hypothetical protein n=1 Tax=Kitasatospora sp. NPDC002040 TaxID=3154661 RepID=UPI003330A14B